MLAGNQRRYQREKLASDRGIDDAEQNLNLLYARSGGDKIEPLHDNILARSGDYLLENRLSEMDPAQRLLQALGLMQGVGTWARKNADGEATWWDNIAAGMDVTGM
jgi:hypothetical protein